MTIGDESEIHRQRSTHRLREFDPNAFDWDEWEILFETHLAVENVQDEERKRNLLITSLGVQPFKTLIAICKPKKPTECGYEQLIEKLRSNYAQVTFASTERIKFFAARQDSSQTLTNFANALRDKATKCDFPQNFYEQALITAFVGGLVNDHVRKYLMQRELSGFEETLNSAKTIESVLIEGTREKGSSLDDSFVNQINVRRRSELQRKDNQSCFSCGQSGHLRDGCRFRNASCFKCQKTGHIAKVCRSSTGPRNDVVNSVNSSVVGALAWDKPAQVVVKLNGHRITLQLDTGSPVTMLTERTWDVIGRPTLQRCTMKLVSFTGHRVKLKGRGTIDVGYDQSSLRLDVLVASGTMMDILGRDWISALKLDAKPWNNSINAVTTASTKQVKTVQELIGQYREVFDGGLGCCKVKAQLYLKPAVSPTFCKPRSLPFAYREAVEEDLNRLVKLKVLEPITVSKWAAPVVVVPKPGGKVRICADLSTGLNQALDINQYPLPKPSDIFVALNGGKQFSKIDLSDAYLQVEVDEIGKEILVINTHKGLFRYNRLPFGVASAPSIFQNIMDQMLAGIPGAVAYLDDIIITGGNSAEHLSNLQHVFQRIKEYGFRLNKEKCKFLQDQVEYLGFLVNKEGVHTSPTKVQAILDMPEPSNVSQLRSYLGMVNHYGKFIPKLTERLFPFYRLLRNEVAWQWDARCDEAFASIKKCLSSPIALAHYDPTLPLVLAADASSIGVGAVIYHRYPDGTERTIAHTSKTLTTTEQKYAQIEKEALALVFGVQKFDQFVRGRNFTLLTDHKPLISIFGPKKGIPVMAANRLQRWALQLMGYSFNIEYRPTQDFGQADGLSRLPVGPDEKFDLKISADNLVIAQIQEEVQSQLPLRANQIAEETRRDSVLSKIRHYILSGWPHVPDITENLRPYHRIREEMSSVHGCLVWGLRTIIPLVFRKKLLDHLHSTHAGMGKMKADARRYFWWPSLDMDIEEIARKCTICTENSKQPPKVPLQQWNVPEKPWQRLHIDFLGKFLNHYFFVLVDAHSKWLEVIPMASITSSSTIKALTSLFSRYGLCDEIVSDNGSQFTSDEFMEFCGRHGIRHIRTAPGHPQSNGQAERYVETVKSALIKGTSDGRNLFEVLQNFLFHYRSTAHSTTNVSPAELFLKREFKTVLDLLRPAASDMSMKARIRYDQNFNRHTKERFFKAGDLVLVRDFRRGSDKVKWTAGTLMQRVGRRVWSVQVNEKIWRRHENQLKKRFWEESKATELTMFNQPRTSEPSDAPASLNKDQEIGLGQTTEPITGNDPPPNNPTSDSVQTSRYPSRTRKPVQRLIEERTGALKTAKRPPLK